MHKYAYLDAYVYARVYEEEKRNCVRNCVILCVCTCLCIYADAPMQINVHVHISTLYGVKRFLCRQREKYFFTRKHVYVRGIHFSIWACGSALCPVDAVCMCVLLCECVCVCVSLHKRRRRKEGKRKRERRKEKYTNKENTIHANIPFWKSLFDEIDSDIMSSVILCARMFSVCVYVSVYFCACVFVRTYIALHA